MVELREDNVVATRRGEDNEDLLAATPDFIRIGKMLGESLGLDDMVYARVVQRDEAITFAESGDRRIGIIHQGAKEQHLNIHHGT